MPAVLKRPHDGAPWHHPASAFFGARGLVPPFVPAVLHEAAAWARLGGDDLLGHGIDARGPWILVRRRPGRVPSRGSADARSLLLAGATFLARLHARDVLHRDVHPGNVLVEGGRVAVLDLDLACVGGLGVPGRVGKRRFRAPETLLGQEDGRSDLYALGETVVWCAGTVPEDLRALVAALRAPDPAARPASANEVLDALGAEPEAAPALFSPHPALAAWSRTRWADIVADPARLVSLAMTEDLDRHALAAVAGRFLARAAASPDAWSAVATLCHRLWERTGEVAYGDQAEEAERRARSERAAPGRASTPGHDLHGWRPDDPAAWVLGVRRLLARGDTETIARALGVVGGSLGPAPFALASEEALAAGAHVPARVFAELGLTLFPDAPALHVTRAGALLLAGDVPAARRAVDALVLAHPGDPHGWLLRAAVERAEGKDPARSLATAEALASRTRKAR